MVRFRFWHLYLEATLDRLYALAYGTPTLQWPTRNHVRGMSCIYQANQRLVSVYLLTAVCFLWMCSPFFVELSSRIASAASHGRWNWCRNYSFMLLTCSSIRNAKLSFPERYHLLNHHVGRLLSIETSLMISRTFQIFLGGMASQEVSMWQYFARKKSKALISNNFGPRRSPSALSSESEWLTFSEMDPRLGITGCHANGKIGEYDWVV